jgi:hypothetical protein
MSSRIPAVLFVLSRAALGILVALSIWALLALREIRSLRAHNAQLEGVVDTVCTFTKLTLRNDLHVIESEPGDLARSVLARIYGSHAGDDANTMDACMGRPFDRAAWVECRTSGDAPCITRMLLDAVESIDAGR